MPTAKKSSSRANGAATHPTWLDMIKECIVDNPSDARVGVSRPMIKKFVENKYHIDLNPLTASQLNRAINSGSEKGIFLLPKGPSGKVKLAPKSRPDTAKENTSPPFKKPVPKAVTTKAKATTAKAPAKKPAGRVTTRATPKPKGLATTTKAKKVKPAATKAPVKKLAATTKKPTTHKKSAPTKKKTTAKRGAAKKAAVKSTKASKIKPPSKAKAKSVKPLSKTKPTSKTAA